MSCFSIRRFCRLAEWGVKMQKNKKVLLIGGGGTLGSYTGKELLRLGFSVDVICLEDRKTQNPQLRFYRETATETFLEETDK